jgi:4-hydroxy-tetrahydrodipicolinate reductase
MTPLRVALVGQGRLGREIEALIPLHDAQVHAVFTRRTPVRTEALRGADVMLDVSSAESVVEHVQAAMAAGIPIAIGTTGWQAHEATVRELAAGGGVLVAPNFSFGVALFTRIFALAAQQLTPAVGFDAHMIETHHAAKRDAPSGTALRLRDAAARTELPITSIRVGHVPGTHTVIFDAPHEQVTLTHEARDRRVFADGALRAARWLTGRTGWFTMDDVVTDLIRSHT